jgi:hypothetical protein
VSYLLTVAFLCFCASFRWSPLSLPSPSQAHCSHHPLLDSKTRRNTTLTLSCLPSGHPSRLRASCNQSLLTHPTGIHRLKYIGYGLLTHPTGIHQLKHISYGSPLSRSSLMLLEYLNESIFPSNIAYLLVVSSQSSRSLLCFSRMAASLPAHVAFTASTALLTAALASPKETTWATRRACSEVATWARAFLRLPRVSSDWARASLSSAWRAALVSVTASRCCRMGKERDQTCRSLRKNVLKLRLHCIQKVLGSINCAW